MTDNKKKSKRKSDADKEKQRRMKRVAAIVAAVCFVAVAGLATWSILFSGLAPSSAVVRIPANATKQQLHDSIATYLGEPYAKKVSRLVGLRATDLKTRHGAYLIEAGMSP